MDSAPPTANGKYQVFPYFSGQDGGCTDAAFLLPPDFTYGAPLPPVLLRFVYLGGADWQSAQYRVSNPDFAFAFVPVPPLERAPEPPYRSSVAAQVTVLGHNAWKCAPAARRALVANWASFWEEVEARLEAAGVLVPGATFLLARQVAEIVPAPLQETLFYHFGMQPGFAAETFPCVDVQPGMQLRVEFEASQFLSPGGPTNGYLGAAQFRWAVQSAPGPSGRTTTFDAFLSTISAPSVAVSASPVAAGGLPDLQAAGRARKHVRLCYPQSLPAGTDPGNLGLTESVALLGADTLADLAAATTAYRDGTCTAGAAPRGVTCTIFRGRAVVVPEISVWLQLGADTPMQLQYVPVGTTLANLLERVSGWKPLGWVPGRDSPVSLWRPSTTGAAGPRFLPVLPSPPAGHPPADRPGCLPRFLAAGFLDRRAPRASALDPRVLDLPLVRGDRLLLRLQ